MSLARSTPAEVERLDLVGDYVVGHVLVGPPPLVGRHAAGDLGRLALVPLHDRLVGIGHEVPRGRIGPHAGLAQDGHGDAAQDVEPQQSQGLGRLPREQRIVMSPDARDEIELMEVPGAPAGRLSCPRQMPGGHLRARFELALLLPQRMRQQESDRIGAAPLGERQDDGLLFGLVGQLDLEGATADGLIAAESGERQFDRRPFGQASLAIQSAVERPFPQVDPRAPLAAFHFDRLGRQIPVLDVDEAAQRDAELPGRRVDDLQPEEHVGSPPGRGRDAQRNADCQAEREDRFHGV